LYSTRRLKEAARARRHDVRVFDTLQFTILVEQGRPALRYRNRDIGHLDAVIPRIGASITFFGTAVTRQFEQMGVFCLNTAAAISVSRDKLRSIQALSRHKIGLAGTAFVKAPDGILKAIEEVGGAPVVIKLIEGTQGVGVILADNNKVAEAIIETLQSARQHVLIQKFVSESRGTDIRAFVVGGRVVAAMRRRAQAGEFRSNVHRGGSASAIRLDPEYERTAVLAAHVMGLHVAGVDMLEGKDGPRLMEVNSSPGLEGIEKATGVDVAGAVIDYLEERVSLPELDLHQKLKVARGYGVAELTVAESSILSGKTLAESRLRDMDISVLCITRESILIPVPRGDERVLPGDVLLCFGKLITLKSLSPSAVPDARKRKRRR
ncbi:MAG TPA: RimK family alpha-L-glutamate ligase, partial [Candidatus Saccharimonadales bacterium]|nr:RimK family alpha-L-glutamate ligase [Candidatus Saccharimonadales bacterium]